MRFVDKAHSFISKHLSKGDVCIDATAGNGHDSLFMAKLVTCEGSLFSFDIQVEALTQTKKLLTDNDCMRQAKLIHDCHSKMKNSLNPDLMRRIKVVAFNLGYLPSGNHKIITKKETTIKAITEIYDWIDKNGVISVVAYRGHYGGIQETNAIQKLVETKNYYYLREENESKPQSPVFFKIYKSKRTD